MPPLALISLTTPLMLGGLALLALPIAAHLLNRRARRKIVFPTIRLLAASAASQSQLFKLRRLILLALRSAMVALVVLAFARPLWRDASAAGNADDAAGVVVLVDASASAGQTIGGGPLAERLRGEAGRTLDSLRAGTDVANLVFATARPQAAFPRLSANFPALRDELRQLSASYERADLRQALVLAGEQLARHSGPRRLVLHADWQQSNWREVLEGTSLAEVLPPNTAVTLVEVADAPPDNVGLAAPRCYPPRPIVGQVAQLAVQATNYSAADKQVRVALLVDGVASAEQTVTLAPGEQRDVAFDATLPSVEDREIEFTVQADGLAADNTAYLVVRAAERLPVVLVGDDDPTEPGTAGYFLARALAPHNDDVDRYEVRHVGGARLTADELRGASAVFVGYLGELPAASAAALIDYARGGGGAIVFCGAGPVPGNLQALEAAAGEGGALPWLPGAARDLSTRDLAGRDAALRITTGRWQSRLLREFDEQSRIAFSQIRFRRVWTIASPREDAQELLSFSDGTPALSARAVGSGQMLLANFSPALDSSDLGKYGAFVALMQVLARELRPAQDEGEALFAGQTVRFPGTFSADGEPIAVDGSDGAAVPPLLYSEGGRLAVHVDRPRRPGFYRCRRGDERLATVAVNVDPRESDLRRTDRDVLLAHFERAGLAPQLRDVEGFQPVLPLRGKPLWGWLLAAAMGFVGLELFCLGYWRR